MRSPADRDLVARDPALPALAELLDPDALLQSMQTRWPDAAILDVEPFYLRYKPGTSCLAGYRVGFNGGQTLLSLTARRRDSDDKIGKHLRRSSVTGPLGFGRTLLGDTVTVAEFPNDARLPALREPMAGGLHLLRYRPERRCVFRADGPRGPTLLKFYRGSDFEQAARNAGAFRSSGRLLVPSPSGISAEQATIATSWIDGLPVRDDFAGASAVGEAVAALHAQRDAVGWAAHGAGGIGNLFSLAEYIARLWPPLEQLARETAALVAHGVREDAGHSISIHGDLHLDQFIGAGDQIGIVDFDEAGLGDPAWDLGNLAGHLMVDALRTGRDPVPFIETVQESYRQVGGIVSNDRIRAQTAHSIFRLAARPFRERVPDWPERIEQILSLAQRAAGSAVRPVQSVDPALPWIEAALDADAMASRPEITDMRIVDATLTRHKPGRRCVIHYALDDGKSLIGKMRAKGADVRSFALQRDLWGSGFDIDPSDGIWVAEPVALVPSLSMWIQRELPGVPFGFGKGRALVDPRRTAQAIAKLHASRIRPARRHMLEDEVRILEERLDALTARRPDLATRLDALRRLVGQACDGASPAVPRPIHRDFYHDHLLVDGVRLAIIDLDLLSFGDPALDVGNFTAHLIEWALREHGSAGRLADWRQAFKHHYRQTSGTPAMNIELYEWLSLVRLVEIADRMPTRRHVVGPLLDLTESMAAPLLSPARRMHDA